MELLNLWVFTRWHQLGFILPFKVSRLTVISTISGIPAVRPRVDPQESRCRRLPLQRFPAGLDDHFSARIGARQRREISLEKGILILNYAETRQVVFVLLATNITKTLRQALDYFAIRFFQQYNLDEFTGGDISQFDGTAEIVKECFGFVPE